MQLATRIADIKPSPTIEITTRASVLAAAGVDVIQLGAGEPDFDTPEHIKKAAYDAIARGASSKYAPAAGLPQLREAIAAKLARDNHLQYSSDQIVVGCGGKQILYNAFMATLNPGDEVLIPTPYWVSYPDMVKLAGGVPVFLPGAAGGFKLQPSQLAEAITPRTRWLVLNTPSNPTGSGYTREELLAFGPVLEAHPQLAVLTDDIYEKIVYDDFEFVNLVQALPFLQERALVVNGLSKAYCMTGWRVGYGAGPRPLIRAMSMLQSQSTTSTATVSQHAALAALTGDETFLAGHVAAFQARRDLVVARLNAIEGLHCFCPQGAFYVYPSCAGLIGRRTDARAGLQTAAARVLESDQQVASWLLDEARLALVPGEAFGLSPYFRISYALATDRLEEACERLGQAVATLS